MCILVDIILYKNYDWLTVVWLIYVYFSRYYSVLELGLVDCRLINVLVFSRYYPVLELGLVDKYPGILVDIILYQN